MEDTQQDAQTEATDRRKQSWGTVALVVIVFIIVLLLWRYCVPTGEDLDEGTTTVATAVIPDVLGLNESDAVEAITDAGFTVDSNSVFDTSVDLGTVVAQSPDAGVEAELGSSVAIDLATDFGTGASGSDVEDESVVVPDVVGKQESSAIDALESAGFVVSSRRANVEPYARDAVYDQYPDGGTKAAFGSSVTINISNGPQDPGNRTTPDCLGLSEDQAVAKIRDAGLTPLVLKRPYPSSIGKVYDQFPLGGDVVPAGSQVTVLIGTSN